MSPTTTKIRVREVFDSTWSNNEDDRPRAIDVDLESLSYSELLPNGHERSHIILGCDHENYGNAAYEVDSLDMAGEHTTYETTGVQCFDCETWLDIEPNFDEPDRSDDE